MKRKTEQALKVLTDIVAYFDLQIEYVVDLPDNVAGILQPHLDPHFILVNNHKSPSDHVFTIAHELAHYILHVNRRPVNFLPAFLQTPWKSKPVAKFSSIIIRWARRKLGPEWQADAWAFLLLMRIGAVDDLLIITEIYPNKKTLFWLLSVVSIYNGIKQRTKIFFSKLSIPSLAQRSRNGRK